jgi:hypothetical protein
VLEVHTRAGGWVWDCMLPHSILHTGQLQGTLPRCTPTSSVGSTLRCSLRTIVKDIVSNVDRCLMWQSVRRR